jgi:hypothetical protein
MSCAKGGIRRLIKNDYIGKHFFIDIEDRTKIIRLFLCALKQIQKDDYRTASVIRQFLRRFHLSNAEIHAVLFHIGFRYSSSNNSGSYKNIHLDNIKINGYYDFQKKKSFRDATRQFHRKQLEAILLYTKTHDTRSGKG